MSFPLLAHEARAAVPSAPLNLQADACIPYSPAYIKLTWSPPTSGPVTYYDIQDDGGNMWVIPGSNLTFTAHGATAGTWYDYTVWATNADGAGQSADVRVMASDYPSVPTVTATPGAGQVTLSWGHNGFNCIYQYEIRRASSSSGPFTLLATVPAPAHNADRVTYTDSGLGNGATFYYWVRAINYRGGSAFHTDSATTFTTPGAPPSLQVQGGPGAGDLTLSWGAASNGGDPSMSYRVYRSTSASGTYTQVSGTVNALTYTDSGLGNGVTRFYKVLAVNAVGAGPFSPVASGTTYTLPAAPGNVLAHPGKGWVNLRWDAASSSAPILHYNIYKGTSNGGETLLTTSTWEGYDDATVTVGTRYYYKVSAVNVVGEGPLSAESSAVPYTTPSAPLNVAAQGLANGNTQDSGGIRVKWDAPASDGWNPISAYNVYRDGSLLGSVAGSARDFLDNGCPALTSCAYHVSATNAAGEGALSSEVDATGMSTQGGYVQQAGSIVGEVLTCSLDPNCNIGGGPGGNIILPQPNGLPVCVTASQLGGPTGIDPVDRLFC